MSHDTTTHRDTAINHFNTAISLISSMESVKKDDILDAAEYYLSLGKVYEKSSDYTEAIKQYNQAQEIYKNAMYPVYESVAKDLVAQVTAKIDTTDASHYFSQITSDLMTSQKMARIEKKYYHNKALRKYFLREKHRIAISHSPLLYVLKRWNSFAPILSSDRSPSKGGGYFLNTGNLGIVFDPGFDFIQNFRNAKFCFNDIDYIFITHAHNDHMDDLESLTSLLHDYNENIRGGRFSEKENCIYRKMMRKFPDAIKEVLEKKVDEAFLNSPRRKHINIFVSPGAKEKGGYLKLGSSQEYSLITLNTTQVDLTKPSGGVIIHYGCDQRIEVFPVPAKHYDLMTDSDCFGYLIHLIPEEVALYYTGDTGFSDDIEKNYSAINRSIHTRGLVLLAHIGGFKQDEQFYYRTNEPKKAFYKTHLGRLGVSKMIECIRPTVCLLSEFGEEFAGCRKDLAEIYSEYYKPEGTFILPVDVGFVIDLCPYLDSNNKYYFNIMAKNALNHNEAAIPTPIANVKCEEKEENKEWMLGYFWM